MTQPPRMHVGEAGLSFAGARLQLYNEVNKQERRGVERRGRKRAAASSQLALGSLGGFKNIFLTIFL